MPQQVVKHRALTWAELGATVVTTGSNIGMWLRTGGIHYVFFAFAPLSASGRAAWALLYRKHGTVAVDITVDDAKRYERCCNRSPVTALAITCFFCAAMVAVYSCTLYTLPHPALKAAYGMAVYFHEFLETYNPLHAVCDQEDE